MKFSLFTGLMILGCAGLAMAGPSKTELDKRIANLTTELGSMQDKPDKKIPAENFRKARGIILMDRTKGGLVFSYQGGSGVALVRNGKNDKWGPAAFISGSEAGFGLQGGGEHSFYVILLMTTNSIRMVRDSNFEFGGEVRGTAGDASAGAKGTANSTDAVVLVYDDSKGFFGGAAVKGDSINPDADANQTYYGDNLTMREIISGEKAKISDPTKELIKKLDALAKK
jgi:lipid-binding SYLF domain-containing protein